MGITFFGVACAIAAAAPGKYFFYISLLGLGLGIMAIPCTMTLAAQAMGGVTAKGEETIDPFDEQREKAAVPGEGVAQGLINGFGALAEGVGPLLFGVLLRNSIEDAEEHPEQEWRAGIPWLLGSATCICALVFTCSLSTPKVSTDRDDDSLSGAAKI
jgi:MFS family permease